MAIDFDALDLVRTKNKAKMYEQKQKEKKDKLETIKKIAKKLNLFCDATDRASDNGFKYLYMDKAEKIIKDYANKIQKGKNKMKTYRVCPTLDIFKDVKANNEWEAKNKVQDEIDNLINWKKIMNKNYQELNCDDTYITDEWYNFNDK